MKMTALLVAALAVSSQAAPKTPDVFYVYQDKGASVNHYVPSGWMGDYGDLKLKDDYTTDCADGKTCIEVTYSAKGAQGTGWAGIYWQAPANNWGNKPGGFDLTGYKRLTFWARGAKGGEVINDFKIGGITGEFGDSDGADAGGPITLTKDWKKYTVDLEGKTLTHVIGGFCWATSREVNPEGFKMYFDEIRYEK